MRDRTYKPDLLHHAANQMLPSNQIMSEEKNYKMKILVHNEDKIDDHVNSTLTGLFFSYPFSHKYGHLRYFIIIIIIITIPYSYLH